MAVELKSNDTNNTLQKESGKNNVSMQNDANNTEYYIFHRSDIVIYALSILIYIINVITDILVIIQCHLHNYSSWVYTLLIILIIPIVITQIISVRLYQKDVFDIPSRILHILFTGILQRYINILILAVQYVRNGQKLNTKESILQLQNEILTINLLVSFLMDAPQSVMQMYIWTVTDDISIWTGISIIMSLISIAWVVMINAKYTLKNLPQKHLPPIPALIVEILWRSGFLISRIAVLVLCVLCTKAWLFILIGLHWLGMTIWLSMQKSHLWITSWQEWAYSCLMGVINCFDYIQFQRNDRSWFKTWIFYSVMLVENIVLLMTYVLYFKDMYKLDVLILYCTVIIGGTALGLISMLLYNLMFKCTDNTILCLLMNFKSLNDNITENNDSNIVKSSYSSDQQLNDFSQGINISHEVTADKKSLLNNIVQNTDIAEKGITNRSFTIADESENSECKIVSENEESSSFSSIQRQKRRGICPSLEVDLEKEEMKLDDLDTNLSSHKRRGICSLTQLCEESTNIEKHNESLLTNSILQSENDQMNKSKTLEAKNKLKFEVSGENDEKLIETRSHVSSIHDYENLCPLGVARPPWCIRSWKGYTDIETYIHDDSVVRDRRRDTLTSTATATTLSSEYSDNTYMSFPFRRILKRNRQDDYLDTLVYDLVDFESNNEKLGSVLKEDTTELTLFAAKPVVIDDRGGMLSLDTILEEHEDISPRKPTNSLVATIDKIRTQMAENSPRHIYYHRNESQWEELETRVSLKRTSLATVFFDSQYQEMSSKYNSPWRYSSSLANCYNELDVLKEIYSCNIPLIDAVLSDSPILGSRTDVKDASIKSVEDITELCDNKEDNVYVDMSGKNMKKPDEMYETLEALIAETEAISLTRDVKDKDKVVTALDSKFSLDVETDHTVQNILDAKLREMKSSNNVVNSSEKQLSDDKQQTLKPKARKKIPLLRERLDLKSDFPTPPTNHWSKAVPNEGTGISIILSEQSMFDSAIAQEKENLDKYGFVDNSINKSLDNKVKDKSCRVETLDIKEKRSIFLKQILSPPKFHGWSKKRTFSPNAKIT